MLPSAAECLYKECCELYGVKPNRDIVEQLSRPNFLTIRHIDASRTFLGELGVMALLDFVASHAGIRRLVLVKNGVSAACVERLCGVLRESPSLSFIDLCDNPMSTPSVRLLWETAMAVPHVQEINVEKCGVHDDWIARLQRCCKSNTELQQFGFYPYGPERSLGSWETVFVLVLGPEPLVQAYCTNILPYVGSFISRFRLRIAPLRIEDTDTHDVVKSKVLRSSSMQNYALSWCVALIDESNPWSDPDSSALTAVLRQEEPIVPPLRNKLGVLREPLYRCVKHLFVYAPMTFSGDGEGGSGKDPYGDLGMMISPAAWLPAVGIETVNGVNAPPAVVLTSESSWKIRCQTDLCASLCTVFSERPRSMTLLRKKKGGEAEGEEEEDESTRKIWESIEKEKIVGSLHPRCKDIAHYIETAAGQASVPLILYGAANLDKSKILSWVAASYSAMESLRVVPYFVTHENQSLVAFLFHLLGVFSKKLNSHRHVYRSLEELCMSVHEAICNYNGEMVLLLLSSIDLLDNSGSQRSLSLEWLPSSLPQCVRVILSLNTESPLLTASRKRMPQPYEILITPWPKQVRFDLFMKELLRRDVAGMVSDPNSIIKGSNNSRPYELTKALESLFLQKDGSESLTFGIYTVSFLQRVPDDVAGMDAAFILTEEVPDTLDDILIALLRRYEGLSDLLTIQYITLSLATSPLPISELIYICEELGPCARQKTLPVIFMMSDDGILTVTSDSIVHLSGSDVRQVVLKIYAEMHDNVSVLVETHLYRLVKTQSPDMSFCFRHLVPIMIANGSFDAAYSLILNPIVVDALLARGDDDNCTHAIDLIFRLLNTRELLRELGEGISCPMEQSICRVNRGALRSALETLQLYDGFFFQSSLLASDVSQYHVRAMESVEVPYTVLVPLNRDDEDDATYSLECKQMPVHCQFWGDYLVVTTTQEVLVYSAEDFEKVIARAFMPFESKQNLRGALMASGTRVIVIGDGQLLLWDFAGESFTLFEDTTSSLSRNALDSFYLNLVVFHPLKEQMSIIDVSKKKVVLELPPLEALVHEALFCGNGILARTLYDLFLIREKEVLKLAHTGAIICMTVCGDGRLIASCVREDIWIWSNTGELLHIIDAGLTPVEDLRFNANGTLLLSWQCEDVKMWQSLSGSCGGTLEYCFDEKPAFVCFTEDASQIIGRCGAHICVWDAHTRQPLGALTASRGHFTFIQERNRMIIGATSKNEVKIWRTGTVPLPSIQRAKEKSLTSSWRKNGKLSQLSIARVGINASGTLLAVVDGSGAVILQPMDGSPSLKCDVRKVESAFILADMIFFTVRGNSDRFYWKEIYSASAVTQEILLPKDAFINATLDLVGAGDEGSVAVISNAEGRNIIYVYKVPDGTLTNQFLGHSSRIIHAFFAGDFLFSSGDDSTIRLWSLLRHAERTLYTHDCPIIAATQGHLATLFFIDNKSRLYHAHVENIASSAHARFVVDEVELSLTIPTTLGVRQIIYASDLLITATDDGSLYVIDLRQGGTVSRLSNYKCLSLTATFDGNDTYVVTGHSTGEVLLHHVRFSEQM